jgi:hypothetical protein
MGVGTHSHSVSLSVSVSHSIENRKVAEIAEKMP